MNTFGMDTQLLSLKEALELVISRYRDAGCRYVDIIFELDEIAERLHPLAHLEVTISRCRDIGENDAEAQP